MGMPNIPKLPEGDFNLTPEQAVTIILASIGMEELGLAHVINAEGEKLQAAVQAFKEGKIDINDLLNVNRSVDSALGTVLKKEIVLQTKLPDAAALLARVMDK
ncbi:hypothetical protein ABEO66_27275 [Bacillus pacificus]|uniref:hypothetical protein n=1 Tax=Bacillus pacificus TaxID=2026187 RepID=UPI003D1C249E